LAEVADEAARAQVSEVVLVALLVLLAQVLPAEAQVPAVPVPAEVPVGPVLAAAATRLQLHVEAAVRPFPA
jgi:hypothetical protein